MPLFLFYYFFTYGVYTRSGLARILRY